MERYFVIVERGHPELLGDLNAVFGHEGEAEIILDRRSRQGWAWSGWIVESRRIAPTLRTRASW